MPAPYSLDLRNKIIDAYDSGKYMVKEIAEMFSVSTRTVWSYTTLRSKKGSLDAGKSTGRPTTIEAKGKLSIRRWVEQKPDIMLSELCEKYFKKYKIKVGTSIMCRALQEMELNRKKKSLYAAEQDTPEIKKKEKNL